MLVSAMQQIELRTGVWYDDRPVMLEFPDLWQVDTHWPDTPPPLTDEAIEAAIAAPVGQPPLRELARGRKRPVIIVDDISRPTPVHRIMPHLLRELSEAGIDGEDVRVVVATGTHGAQDATALTRKLGQHTFATCHVITHDHAGLTKPLGKTSFGTPVYVNREVADSDLVIGVGGIYPQHTTGFSGGAKLALGVLGIKSIASLHFGHEGVDGAYDTDNSFRHDVAEIARMIGLTTMFTLHIDGEQRVVSLMCGDHFQYFDRAVEFTLEHYHAPSPGDADVVVANAHPVDTCVFFMRKAMAPIDRAQPRATTVMVASNHGGIGYHGLFYPTRNPRMNALRMQLVRVSIMDKKVLMEKVWRRLTRRPPRETPTEPVERTRRTRPVPRPHLWVYAPPGGYTGPGLDGMTITGDWEKILRVVGPGRRQERVKVRVYPCPSLQCIQEEGAAKTK